MSSSPESKGVSEEVSHLLKTLIEVELSQNELLTRLSAKLDTALCVLEHISRNTCESLNEAYEQTELIATLTECKELCVPPPKALPCPEEPLKSKPHCTYEPCELREEGGGSAVSLSGSAPPQHVFGAPYPPAVRTESPDEKANELPAPDVPIGPFRGFLIPGKDIKLLDFRSGGGQGGMIQSSSESIPSTAKMPRPSLRSLRTSVERKAAASC